MDHGKQAALTMAFLLAAFALLSCYLFDGNQYWQESAPLPSTRSTSFSSSPSIGVSGNISILFVKFHKVAGTTITTHLAKLCKMFPAGVTCKKCGSHQCSLPLAKTLRSFAMMPANQTTRRRLFYESLAEEVPWLLNGATLKIFTILRDPAERLRSKYYFQRGSKDAPGWCVRKYGDLCAAGQLTFLEWMKYRNGKLKKAGGKDIDACCETVDVLGGGNLTVGLSVLQLFDVVGITERMHGTISEINLAMGRNYTNINHMLNNTKNKKAWTEEERALAWELTRADRTIYNVALKMAEDWGTTRP